jgi:pentatricopeptide repeat protein
MAGKPNVAAELLERMRRAGCPPNVVIYTSLLSAYGAAGDVGSAEGVLRNMQAVGCPPNSRTYTELMSHLLALGGWGGGPGGGGGGEEETEVKYICAAIPVIDQQPAC